MNDGAASATDGNSESIAGTAKLGGYWYIDIYSFDDGLVNYRLKVEVSDVTGATDPITLGDAPSGQNPGKQLEH